MDRVVDTQLELYTSWLQATKLRSFVLYTWYRKPGFQMSLHVNGSWVCSFSKCNMVRKIK